MKVALVHDDLVQWGGAERVLVALSEIFPEAPIYTLAFNQNNPLLNQNFKGKKIITSFVQKIPFWLDFYKASLPLHPFAFEQFDFSEYDLVISQTTRFAKSIITKPGTKHICYCHTPPRFLWNFSGEITPSFFKPYLSYLRIYDRISSQRVDHWLAGSINAQERITKVYQARSTVIYPFVDLERFTKFPSFDGGFLLAISRLNFYKRVDLIVRAANLLKMPLKVVGVGSELNNLRKIAGSQVEFINRADEHTLSWLLAGCTALVIAGEEDFGLTSLEAQAAGKPVIAYGKGGVLESVIDRQTGYLFKYQTVEDIVSSLQSLNKKGYNKKKCREQAQCFSKEVFTKNFQNLISVL